MDSFFKSLWVSTVRICGYLCWCFSMGRIL